jgi:hypothetical protein
VFDTFRDCLYCHDQTLGEASVHHLTIKAKEQNCKACHGPIDNPLDGHYIPTYAPSLVTPWPSDKPNPGPNGEGECTFCHAAGLNTATGLSVLSNADTHHSTGLGKDDSSQCLFCHDFTVPEDRKIRACEKCHGVASLHNIQANSNNPANLTTIVPGKENAYWGHIGHNDDCMGCHGFTALSAAAPYSGPVIPNLSKLNVSKVTKGTSVVITASGSGFTNVVTGPDGDINLTSKVVLTSQDGIPVELVPGTIAADSLTVTLPSNLSAGNYEFRVVKAGKGSNAVNLSVVPAMKNTSIVCSGTSITIKGTGYSQYIDALNSGSGLIAVDIKGKKVACKVNSWNDTQITATCAACPSTVSVSSIWGKDTDRTSKTKPSKR